MGLVEMLDMVAKYYEKATTKKLPYARRILCTQMLQSGLTVKNIMDAIDAAVLRHGLGGVDRDYWQMIHKNCKDTYKRLVAEGVIEAPKKAAP